MRLGLVFLVMSIVPITYAANFYTIIGPDGRPIIVQKPIEAKKKQKIETKNQAAKQNQATQQDQFEIKHNSQNKTDISKDSILTSTADSSETLSKQHKVKELLNDQTYSADPIMQKKTEKQAVNTTVSKELVVEKNKREERSKNKLTFQSNQIETTQNSDSQSQTAYSPVAKALVPTQAVSHTQNATEKRASENQKTEQISEKKTNPNITKIDGVEYVNNEYLEDREFNLEGKKRFYVMPETGAMVGGRFETVERQKGLSRSLLDRIRKPKPTEQKAVALATTYYRLPKEEVIQTLEQDCFTGKKIEKAKTISSKNQEVNFYPVAPIKENFAYEVVKLDSDIQNILFSSYASSQKKPSYYWPLVVFLDEKGCVVEGVSGFKNAEKNESAIQYSSLEGVLKKPESARYLFMTPLSEAIDIQNHTLTNQGQIKLSVIQ